MPNGPPRNISETAANMALIRALETAKPTRQRLFPIPLRGVSCRSGSGRS
jgi:hypothetical protein